MYTMRYAMNLLLLLFTRIFYFILYYVNDRYIIVLATYYRLFFLSLSIADGVYKVKRNEYWMRFTYLEFFTCQSISSNMFAFFTPTLMSPEKLQSTFILFVHIV